MLALPRSGEIGRVPASAILVTLGLLVSWSATVAPEGIVQLGLLAAGGLTLLSATIRSRRATLALLSVLLIGHVGFTTEFAKISVSAGSLPIYVTDFVLFPVLAGSILGRRWQTRASRPLLMVVAAFAGGAAVFGLAALMEGADLALVLYQATPFVYYPLAALALAWNVNLATDRVLLIRVALIACGVAVAAGLLSAAQGSFFVTEQGVPRYIRGDSGTFLAAVLVALLLSKADDSRSEIALIGAGAVLFLGVLLSEHRSVWLAAGLAFVAGAALSRTPHVLARAAIWSGLAAIAFLTVFLFQTDLVSGTIERFLSTADTDSVNSAWRLAAWNAALTDVADSPFVGHGFGEPFVFYFWGHEYVGAPHNSLLNIAWYMGLPGFALFALAQVAFVARLFRDRSRLVAHGWRPAILFAVWVSLLTVAGFNVILESPVGAMPFWLLVGLPFASDREHT